MRAVADELPPLLGLAESMRSPAHKEPSALLAARTRAAHFLRQGLGWPAGKAEALDGPTKAAVLGRAWQQADSEGPSSEALREAEELLQPYAGDALRLVFINGQPAPTLSRLPEQSGVHLGQLAEAHAEHSSAAAQLGSLGLHTDEGLAALNAALVLHGAYVHIAAHTVVEQPIVVAFITTDAAEGQLVQPRTLFFADEGARATVVERHLGAGEAVAWNNAVSELVLERGAKLTVLLEQGAAASQLHMGTVGLRIGQDASCELTTFDAGAALCRRSIRAELLAPAADIAMWHVALARGQAKTTTHATMRHVAGATKSKQIFKGIADGGGHVAFAGTVHILPGAPQAAAEQLSRGLLLSPTSRVALRPQLMIRTDDVRCQHGATVGELDEEALFYLESRGLPNDLARQMLTLAFLRDALAGLPPSLQQRLLGRVAAWLGQEGAASPIDEEL